MNLYLSKSFPFDLSHLQKLLLYRNIVTNTKGVLCHSLARHTEIYNETSSHSFKKHSPFYFVWHYAIGFWLIFQIHFLFPARDTIAAKVSTTTESQQIIRELEKKSYYVKWKTNNALTHFKCNYFNQNWAYKFLRLLCGKRKTDDQGEMKLNDFLSFETCPPKSKK